MAADAHSARSIDWLREPRQFAILAYYTSKTYNTPVFSFIETQLFSRLLENISQMMSTWRKSIAKSSGNIGLEILEGIREIKRGGHRRMITVPSVTSIREQTGLSQSRFAQLLGVSVRTLQEWAQGRRAPSDAARTLLMIAAKNPHALLEVAWADSA